MLNQDRLLRACTSVSHWKKPEKWVSLLRSHNCSGTNPEPKIWTVFHSSSSRNYQNLHSHRTWPIIPWTNGNSVPIMGDERDPGNTKNEKNGLAFQKHSLGGGDTCGQKNVIKGDRCCDRNRALFWQKGGSSQLWLMWQGKAEGFHR